MPRGMNAYHKDLSTFIRWLPGQNKPISGAVKNVLSQKTNWFMHKELCVFLRWNEEGFFEMSQEESNWHNKKHSENHWLLPKKEFSSSSAAPHDYSAHNLSTTSAAPASLCANYNYVVDLQDSNSVGDSFAAEPNALEGDFDAHDEDDESDKSDDDSSAQAPSKQAWTCSSGGGNDGSRGGGEHAQVGTKRPFSTPSVAVSVADSSTASQISQKQKKTRTSRAYFWTQETVRFSV